VGHCPRRLSCEPDRTGGRICVPVISMFFGLVIRMFCREHGVPHFQAEYQGQLAGAIASRTALRLVKEWALARDAELKANWARSRAGEPLERIAPLD